MGAPAVRGLKAVLPHDDPRWSLVWALGGLVVGLLGLALGFRLEEVLARSRVYRFVRHFVRLAWAGAVFTYGCVSARIGGTYEQWPDHLDWHWIDRKLTPGPGS